MADGGDEFPLRIHFSNKIVDRGMPAHVVRSIPARYNDAVEIAGLEIAERPFGFGGITDLAIVCCAGFRPYPQDIGARLLEAIVGIPDLDLLIKCVNQHRNPLALDFHILLF